MCVCVCVHTIIPHLATVSKLKTLNHSDWCLHFSEGVRTGVHKAVRPFLSGEGYTCMMDYKTKSPILYIAAKSAYIHIHVLSLFILLI